MTCWHVIPIRIVSSRLHSFAPCFGLLLLFRSVHSIYLLCWCPILFPRKMKRRKQGLFCTPLGLLIYFFNLIFFCEKLVFSETISLYKSYSSVWTKIVEEKTKECEPITTAWLEKFLFSFRQGFWICLKRSYNNNSSRIIRIVHFFF